MIQLKFAYPKGYLLQLAMNLTYLIYAFYSILLFVIVRRILAALSQKRERGAMENETTRVSVFDLFGNSL